MSTHTMLCSSKQSPLMVCQQLNVKPLIRMITSNIALYLEYSTLNTFLTDNTTQVISGQWERPQGAVTRE